MFDTINPIQLVIALASVIVLLVMPVVSFGLLGIAVFGLNGYQLLQMRYLIYLLLLMMMLAMMVCSLTPLRKVSIVVGVVELVTLVLMMVLAANILVGNIAPLMALIPRDLMEQTGLTINTASIVLSTITMPGWGIIVNLVLSVLYCVAAFVPDFMGQSGNRGAGFTPSNRQSGNGGAFKNIRV